VGSTEKPLDYALSFFQDPIVRVLIILPIAVYFLWLLFIGLVRKGYTKKAFIFNGNYILALMGILFSALIFGLYILLLGFIQNGGLN